MKKGSIQHFSYRQQFVKQQVHQKSFVVLCTGDKNSKITLVTGGSQRGGWDYRNKGQFVWLN